MQPSKLSEFMTVVRDRFEQAAREGEAPVLVTSAAIRPFVRSLVERFRSQTTVLSQAEIHPAGAAEDGRERLDAHGPKGGFPPQANAFVGRQRKSNAGSASATGKRFFSIMAT